MYKIHMNIARLLWVLVFVFLYLGAKTDNVFQETSAWILAATLAILSCAVLLAAMVSHLQKAADRRKQ